MSEKTLPGFGAARRNHSSIARRRSRLIVGVLLLSAAMGFVSCVATVARSAPEPPPVPARYGAFAQGAAQDVLAGRRTALPTRPEVGPLLGRVVPSPIEGADSTQRPVRPLALAYDYLIPEPATRSMLGSLVIETHPFLVGANEQLFRLTITVAETATGPVVHALPALTPAPMTDASRMAPVPYDRIFPVAVLSEGAREQIRAWAAAFAAGDERALYLLTSDSGPRRYRGLGGYEVVGEPLVSDPYGVVGGVVAQVQLRLRLAANPSFILSASYDLLLGNLDRALPSVPAWGPPGSGPGLVPFGNADPRDPDPSATPDTTIAPLTTTSSVRTSSTVATATPAASLPAATLPAATTTTVAR